ncbi:DMT family transporter [Marinomonas dokdonensis]|uniref:DMT family transporter n=1 Tax=Marinomonas dokdonensis TaxID=328224 RepID=UPI00405542E8
MQGNSEFFTRRYVVFACAVLCTILWGSSYPAIKTGYELLNIPRGDIPSLMVFAGMRFLLAGLFLIFINKLLKRPSLPLNWQNVRQLSLLGATQTCLQYVFFYIGVANTTGVKASIMNATGTFFSVILAHYLYHNDKLNQRKLVGCLVGFAGVFMVNFSDSLLSIDFTLAGEGAVVFAAFILAAGSIYGKRVSQNMDAMQMTAWQLAIGGLILLVIGYGLGGQSGDFGFSATLLLMYLALLSSIAFAVWSLLLKYNPVGMITIFNFLIPIFGTLLSGLFLQEAFLEWKNLIALLLVCFGIYLVTRVGASLR